MQLIDFVLIGIIALALGWAVHTVVKNKKQGASCGGNCANCGQSCANRKS